MYRFGHNSTMTYRALYAKI